MRGMTLVGALLLTVAVVAAADLKPIVDPYVRIQQSLHADSLDGVQDNARAVLAEAAKLGADGEAMQSAARELQQATDLKSVRAAFGKLGDAIMIYAKEADASLGDEVKVAYCPMVRKYWLQKGDAVQNPFYGKEMADCGRINPGLPDLKK